MFAPKGLLEKHMRLIFRAKSVLAPKFDCDDGVALSHLGKLCSKAAKLDTLCVRSRDDPALCGGGKVRARQKTTFWGGFAIEHRRGQD